ncbi:hypothetical protein [Hymenobacter glacialis]|uniref:Uncharacterized protein n=1 Tax=Hymenobacter glacialis TaxID=1908236 RepID=A0A1G1SQT8_9BACT|nr:hypothetical protein [Hymenobacter glacialis]OGX80990.1 hypothetical protein BEN48_07440 [Hymenobacter glacialis]
MAKKPVKPKSKTQDPDKKARVHKELEGFEIGVNPLGEITSNYSIEQINQFLGRHVRDKKLVDRAGQFGEKPGEDDADDEDFPIADAEHAPEPEESDEEFMKRSSQEAKRKKAAANPDAAAAKLRSTSSKKD